MLRDVAGSALPECGGWDAAVPAPGASVCVAGATAIGIGNTVAGVGNVASGSRCTVAGAIRIGLASGSGSRLGCVSAGTVDDEDEDEDDDDRGTCGERDGAASARGTAPVFGDEPEFAPDDDAREAAAARGLPLVATLPGIRWTGASAAT